MAANNIKVSGDFSQLAEFIGSFQGWEERIKTPYHIAQLLAAAHGQATQDFDDAARHMAVPMGFTHMYEWGTAGVLEGDGGSFNPMSQEARLWVHRLAGSGASRSIDFVFRPSHVEVPLPEEAENSDSEFSRHVFTSKAWVTEFGVPVSISPRNAKGIFIGQSTLAGKQFSNEDARERGYMMFPGTVRVPGSTNAGNFQGFWLQWWNTEGRTVINRVSQAIVEGGMSNIIKRGRGRGTALKTYAGGRSPAKTFSVQISTAKATAYTETKAWEGRMSGAVKSEDYDSFLDNVESARG